MEKIINLEREKINQRMTESKRTTFVLKCFSAVMAFACLAAVYWAYDGKESEKRYRAQKPLGERTERCEMSVARIQIATGIAGSFASGFFVLAGISSIFDERKKQKHMKIELGLLDRLENQKNR